MTERTGPPRIGAHMSIGGGLHKAIERAAELRCDVLQLFTKSTTQWAAKPISEADRRAWFDARATLGPEPVMAHDSYLVNLASPDDDLFERSIEAFAVEVVRCAMLRIPFLVSHPGAHLGTGELVGIARAAEGYSRAIELAAIEQDRWAAELAADDPEASAASFCPTILLETTAGQGTTLGYQFEQLRDLLGAVAEPGRFGVCFDTCHVFSAGYDLRDLDGYAMVMDEFDTIVGLAHLRAFHLNDSKRDCGSRIDRHEHIGSGKIGLPTFLALLNDPRFAGAPMVLETPKTDDADAKNLATLRRLIETGHPDTLAS